MAEIADRRPDMRGGWAVAVWLGKVAVIAFVMIAGSVILAGLAPPAPVATVVDTGPLSGLQAMLAINLAVSVVLCLFAARARVTGWHLAALVFVALFGLQNFMMILDGMWFNNTLKLTLLQYAGWGLQSAVIAAAAGLAALLMFRTQQPAEQRFPKRVAWRLSVLTLVYVILYFGAGTWAWQHPVLQTYYAHMQISFGPTVAFQFVRGLLWAFMALFLVTGLRGSLASRALVMATLFGVVTAIQLLYPNPIMPWDVRQVHLVEVGVSEMIYGILATVILLAGTARKNELA